MTVKAEVTSTLNGQSADLILIEDGDTRSYETKTLAGGTETFIFTGLDGGRDKEYTAKIVPSTTDVTATAEVNYGAKVRIDPIPHRDVDADSTIRETAEFNNGVATKELGLGDNPLINGLLTSALNDGEVLADDGFVYETVQAAQDNASSWIFIGPGTFNEAVTIDTAGLTVRGSGYNTLIDAPDGSDVVTIDQPNVTIKSFSTSMNTSQGSNYDGIESTGTDLLVDNVVVRQSDARGMSIGGADSIIINSRVDGTSGSNGIELRGNRITLSNCTVENAQTNAISTAGTDDHVITSNTIISPGDDGFATNSNDACVGSNRIINAGVNGMRSDGADNIFYNNRISGSGSTAIDLSADSGTITDGNNTGASN